ncbi:MAG: aminoacyl--tRNA ligase-related protein [Patescibacteria group bacterium]|jgi:prolyl-tRNA synthetase
MKTSGLFTKSSKEIPAEVESKSAQFLIRGGYIDQLGTGIYSYLPLGFKVLDKIVQIIREEMNAIDGQEILMPALHPAQNWKITDRYDMNVGFKTKSSTGQDYVLGWTHEEIVTPLAKRFVNSYKDLPIALYQIQSKFRDEERPKSGLLRTREFLMKDLYSFHTDSEDLDKYYDRVLEAYKKVYDRVGIGEMTYKTYASGGSFSKYSHEFQTVSDAGEDTIYVCEKCHIAVNKEIIKDVENKCPECGNTELKEKKSIEVGNIFKLGTKYSEPFNLKYLTSEGDLKLVEMGCYGIGPSRLLSTIVEILSDESGPVWPSEVAPFEIYLTGLDEESLKKAEEVYEKLKDEGKEVLFDDSTDRAGEKFARAELYGIPERWVISKNTLASSEIEVKKRTQKETSMISL